MVICFLGQNQSKFFEKTNLQISRKIRIHHQASAMAEHAAAASLVNLATPVQNTHEQSVAPALLHAVDVHNVNPNPAPDQATATDRILAGIWARGYARASRSLDDLVALTSAFTQHLYELSGAPAHAGAVDMHYVEPPAPDGAPRQAVLPTGAGQGAMIALGRDTSFRPRPLDKKILPASSRLTAPCSDKCSLCLQPRPHHCGFMASVSAVNADPLRWARATPQQCRGLPRMQCEALAEALDAGNALTKETWEALACPEPTLGAVVETRTRKLFMPETKRESVLARVQFDACARCPGFSTVDSHVATTGVSTASADVVMPAVPITDSQVDIYGQSAAVMAVEIPDDEITATTNTQVDNAAENAAEAPGVATTSPRHIQAIITTASTARAASVAMAMIQVIRALSGEQDVVRSLDDFFFNDQAQLEFAPDTLHVLVQQMIANVTPQLKKVEGLDVDVTCSFLERLACDLVFADGHRTVLDVTAQGRAAVINLASLRANELPMAFDVRSIVAEFDAEACEAALRREFALVRVTRTPLSCEALVQMYAVSREQDWSDDAKAFHQWFQGVFATFFSR